MQLRLFVVLALFPFLFPSENLFAQSETPTYLQEYKTKGLPPLGETIQFEDTKAFPPQPKGLKQTDTKVDYRAAPADRAPDALLTLRESVLANTKVKKALGKRFTHLGTDVVETEQGRAVAGEQSTTLLRFYSYTLNRVVDVHLAGDKVVSIRPRRKGYQPAESREEVAEAADVVRADKRYRAAVAELAEVRGIVTPSPNGRRHLFLLFYKEKNARPAVFQATVDMNARRVVKGGPVTHAGN